MEKLEELRLYAISGRSAAKEPLRLPCTLSSCLIPAGEGSDELDDADVLRSLKPPLPPPLPPLLLTAPLMGDEEGGSYFFVQPFSASFSWYFSA